MKLTRAERLIVSRIINIRLDSATLKDHILLEGIYKSVKPEEVKVRTPLDFVDENQKEFFQQYDGKPINSIENEEHKKIISEAIHKARIEELEIFKNEEEGEEFNLNGEQIGILVDFFEKDKRPFPREYHAAIVSLHGKLATQKEKK